MKTRALLAIAMAMPLLLAAAQAPQVERPAEAGRGKVEAHLIVARGKVTLVANGRSFPARAGLPLLRTDQLAVDLGSYAIVELANGYLVRVDEDLTMPLADIALLDAPQAPTGLDAQLKALLSASEHREVGAERIIGYHARVTSAESLGPQQAETAMHPMATAAPPPPSAPAPAGVGGARGALRSSRMADAAPPPAPAPAEPAAEVATAAADEVAVEPGSRLEKKEDAKPAPPPVKPAPRWYVQSNKKGKVQQSGPMPKIARDALEDDALKRCLLEELQPRLGRTPDSVEIMLQIRKGVVTRATLGRGLQSFQCLKPFDKQQVPDLTQAAWIVFEVPLP